MLFSVCDSDCRQVLREATDFYTLYTNWCTKYNKIRIRQNDLLGGGKLKRGGGESLKKVLMKVIRMHYTHHKTVKINKFNDKEYTVE